MKLRLLAALFAALVALVTSPAAAEDIRFPATFTPALMIHTPKGWTSTKLPLDNLEIESGDRTAVLTIALSPTLGSPDILAAKILRAQSPPKAKAKLAGLDAFVYRGTATNPDGVKLNLKLFIAPIDPQEAFAVTLITAYAEGDKELAPANAVIAGLKLLRK